LCYQRSRCFIKYGKEGIKNEIIENGDTLIITELDRLGRNKKLILDELRFFHDNNVRVMVLEIPTTLIDFFKFDNSMQVCTTS